MNQHISKTWRSVSRLVAVIHAYKRDTWPNTYHMEQNQKREDGNCIIRFNRFYLKDDKASRLVLHTHFSFFFSFFFCFFFFFYKKKHVCECFFGTKKNMCVCVFFWNKKKTKLNYKKKHNNTKGYLTYPYDDRKFQKGSNGRTGEEFFTQTAAVYEDFGEDERYKTNWIWLSGLQSWHCHGEGFTVWFLFFFC